MSYDYRIYKVGATYYAVDAGENPITSNSNPTTVFAAAHGNYKTTYFDNATYNLTQRLELNSKVGATIIFHTDSLLYVTNNMDDTALRLNTCVDCYIQQPHIDGNSANQTNVRAQPGDEYHGIMIRGGNGNVVVNPNITNCGVSGIYILGTASAPSSSNGVVGGSVTYGMWNCITFWAYDNLNTVTGCYAINVAVSHASDVGIAYYGLNGNISGCVASDMDGSLGDGGNSHWGIAVEGGGNCTVQGNTVSGCYTCIEVTAGADGNTLNGNTCSDCSFGFYINSDDNHIYGNTVTGYSIKAIEDMGANNDYSTPPTEVNVAAITMLMCKMRNR